MAGMAERSWKELRPSSAGQFRLAVASRHDRDRTERRPRQRIRPKLRATTR